MGKRRTSRTKDQCGFGGGGRHSTVCYLFLFIPGNANSGFWVLGSGGGSKPLSLLHVSYPTAAAAAAGLVSGQVMGKHLRRYCWFAVVRGGKPRSLLPFSFIYIPVIY